MKTVRKVVLLLFIAGLGLGCGEEIKYSIPYREVNLKLDLNNLDYDLIPQLNFKTYTERRKEEDRLGFGGILVINGFGDFNETGINLYAYDLACPVEIDPNIRIVPNNDGQATCPVCGAVYNISSGYGNPVSGTKLLLRRYKVSALSGIMQYRVSN